MEHIPFDFDPQNLQLFPRGIENYQRPENFQ